MIKITAKIEQSYKILNTNNGYLIGKNLISELFKKDIFDREKLIFFRLSIIDNYYSTQMSKRLFGLEDLSKKIFELTENDNELKEIALNYINNGFESDVLQKLFNSKFGIDKNGSEKGRAISLISKYLYFLTNYNFPIYDSLAKKSYNILSKNYPELNLEKLNTNWNGYFKDIKQLKDISENITFDKLDNFLWLIGKITKGSYSLIINRENYKKLIDLVTKSNKDKNELKKDTIETIINKYLNNNIDSVSSIFSDDLIEFISYCNSLD